MVDVVNKPYSPMEKVIKLVNIVEKSVYFLKPDSKSRGPANNEWIKLMREIAKILCWPKCDGCNGAGGLTKMDCCNTCLGVGSVDPKDY